MKDKNQTAILYALAAACFYALNVPCSKLLLTHIPSILLAAWLYLGAGLGVGVLYLFHRKKEDKAQRLTRADIPYTVGMVALDIAAPILLMAGVSRSAASSASLLGNFEIVATALIALLFFHEAISKWLWTAIGLITLASVLLSFEGGELSFSTGSLLVLGATVCWGLENNCTRRISDKSTYQIVTIKGVFSGLGSLCTALILGERPGKVQYILLAMLLGFVAYGLSIFTYIRAQRTLGAARTSAYYAAAPFIGALLSFALLREPLTGQYMVALAVMLLGAALTVRDTLARTHTHPHQHTFVHAHDGSVHTHTVVHDHPHEHLLGDGNHRHTHSARRLEREMADHHAG